MHDFTRSKNIALATLVALLSVAVAGIAPAQASTISGPADPTAGKLADAAVAVDQATATAVAQKYAHPVVDDSKTTETSQLTAEPDGTMKLVSNSLPVRVKQAGKWVPIDPKLTSVTNGYSPAAAVTPVIFSAGGSGPIVKVQTPSGKWLSESWPYGDLPSPKIEDASATYEDVLPDVDLRLTATAAGMSEVLVIKSATAASNPQVHSIKLGLSGAKLSANSGVSTKAVASDNSALVSSTPIWWDSSHTSANPDGPGDGGEAQPVTQAVTDDSVTLDLRSIVKSETTVYPLYVDPDWSTGQQAYWFTDLAYPNTTYLNGQNISTGYMSVGSAQSGGRTYRSRAFFQFGTSALAGKHILNAVFGATETGSTTGDTSQVQIYRYGPATAGFTWNTDPGAWNQLLDSKVLPHATASTPQAVGWTATAGVAVIAAAGSSIIQIGLHSSNEASYSTRKHFALGGSLTVSYNTPPNTPQDPTFTAPERACSTSATNPSFVNNAAQPLTMAVSVTDPDAGANVNAAFHVVNGTTLAAVATYGAPQQAQGMLSAQIPMNALAPGLYAWHAQAGDNVDLSAAYSQYCYFQVQNTGPGLPSVAEVTSSTPVTVVAPAIGVVGNSISVRFTASTAGATAEFGYWWTSGAAVSPSPIPPVTFAPSNWDTGAPMCPVRVGPEWFVCADSSGAATVVVAPTDAPQSTLWVVAYDGAGNISTNTIQPNDSSTATGLQVSTTADVDHVQYSSASGGDFWNADDFNSALPSTTGPGIPDTNTTHTTSDMAITNTDMVAPMPLTSPLAGTNVLAFGGQVQLLTSHYTSGNYVTATFWQRPDDVDYWTPPIDQGFMKPYPAMPSGTVAPAPAGMTTLYNCTFGTTGVVMNSISDSCEGSGAVAEPIGFIWTAASSSDHAAYPLYRCGPTGFDVHDPANCTGPVVTTLLGYVEADADRGTVTDSTEMTDDSLHGFTYSAWFNSNPSGQDFSNLPVGATALAYANTFYLTESPTGTWNLCWPDWGPPAYEPCVEGPAVTPGVWTFVSVEWDPVNSQLRLIINGQVNSATVASRLTQSLMMPSNHVFTIGSTNADNGGDNGGSRAWSGYIADLSGFPGVADSTELANLMNENPPQ